MNNGKDGFKVFQDYDFILKEIWLSSHEPEVEDPKNWEVDRR